MPVNTLQFHVEPLTVHATDLYKIEKIKLLIALTLIYTHIV
jgi:hypothetical protein